MLYNIPFSQSFIDIFCQKILNDNKNNKENLFNYLILSPNTRLIRNLQNGFLRNSNASALILPKIISIFDIEYITSYSSILFKDNYKQEFSNILKPTISKRERSFILAKLIKKMDSKLTFNQTLSMAEDLGILIDRAYMEDIDFKDLDKIVEGNLAIHWQEILKFLHIATNFWPEILKDKESIDFTLRQKLIIQLQNKIWQETPPKQPVIALNLLSFNKDNLDLLKTINNLPHSDIYFYGIDRNINEKDFNDLEYNHPQKVISYMLNKLEWKRENIVDIYPQEVQENIIHRVFDNLVYKDVLAKDIQDFANKFNIITTKNEEEEARTIALAMREVLEIEGKTSGLITNNQNLIVRVRNELSKWGIEIDDYLGVSLINSLQAKFFLLVGNIIMNDFIPEDFLALLKHPFCLMGLKRKDINEQSKNLDFYLFRRLFHTKNISTYKNEIKKMEYIDKKIKQKLISFLTYIELNFPEIFTLIRSAKFGAKINFQKTLIEHIKIAEKLTLNNINTQDFNSRSENLDRVSRSKINLHDSKLFIKEEVLNAGERKEVISQSNLWKEQEGRELSLLLAKILKESQEIGEISINEYMEILKKAIVETSLKTIYNKHPRLYIYGELQNTLIHHDLLIVANMNEGSMPFLPSQNLWMNSSMMEKLGFVPMEAQVGLKANVFAQIIGSTEIILIRSEKEQGKISTPSRWLLKLRTFLDYYKSNHDFSLHKKQYLYDIQSRMYTPKTFTPLILDNVTFNPPISYRPKKISATQFESLIKNPYLFFIDRILCIYPLDKINPIPNKKDYGNSLHKVLENFFANLNTFKSLPKEKLYGEIISLVEEQFKTFLADPIFKLFRMPIIKKGIYDLLQEENLDNIDKSYVEVSGSIEIKINEITITLSGKADRIDVLKDDTINIFDYKTTATSKIEEYWKQLLILSLILSQNGFKDIHNKFQEINTKYVFFPNKFSEKLLKKDNGIENIPEFLAKFLTEIENELVKYYVEGISYEFIVSDRKVYDEHKHFMRFDEWNTNLSLNQFDEEN